MLRKPLFYTSVALTLAILAGPLMAAVIYEATTGKKPPAAAAGTAELLRTRDPFYKQHVVAEGVQSWFDCNRNRGLEALGPEGRHICHVNTKEQLKKHLPALAKLIDDAFRQNRWVYVPVAKRLDQPHVRGYDPAKAPTFRWPPEVIEAFNRAEAQKAKKAEKQEQRE